MAISANDKIGLIKVITEDYNEFGGYADDAKNSAALDQLMNSIWQVIKYPEADDQPLTDADPLEHP